MTDREAAPTTEPTPDPAPERGSSILDSMYKPAEPEEPPQPDPPEPDGPEGGEDPPPEPPPEGDEPTPDEPEAETIASIPELVEHQEWDQEWFDTLKVPVKVDGEPAEATMKDLVASYQMNAAADKRLEEAKARSQAQNQELREKSEALDGQFATAAKLIESAEALLDQDSKTVDWAKLREDDPAEYSAKKEEIRERRERIESMKREAVDSYRQTAEQRQHQTQEQFREHVAAEQAKLLEHVPEWRDEKVAADEKAKIVKYLVNDLGFPEQDVMQAADYRLVLLARKARLFDEGRAKVDTKMKKVAKTPKMLKPGPKADQPKSKPDTQDRVGILYG